jgi:hypothetical protein
VLLQGFYREISSVGVVHVPTGIGNVAAGFGDARATDIFSRSARPKRCSRASSPRA